MSETFERLSEDKQAKVLDAAFIEFCEKGYEQASTNQIAKEAGIGKGTLFYYFKSKQTLFHYLVEKAFDIAQEEYLDKINFEETDFFERIKQTTELKWAVYHIHSHALKFLAYVFMHADETVLSVELNEKRKIAEKKWATVLSYNIDFSKLREDIPQETSLNFIRWTVEGYRQELEAKMKQLNFETMNNEDMLPYYEEFYGYLDTLKRIYYKKEEEE